MQTKFKNTDYKVYTCEKCGKELYVPNYFEDKMTVKCPCITCNDFGYNHDEYTKEQYNKLYDLRRKYIGTVYKREGNVYILLDILDLNTMIICNIAGFDLWLFPTAYLKIIQNYLQ